MQIDVVLSDVVELCLMLRMHMMLDDGDSRVARMMRIQMMLKDENSCDVEYIGFTGVLIRIHMMLSD